MSSQMEITVISSDDDYDSDTTLPGSGNEHLEPARNSTEPNIGLRSSTTRRNLPFPYPEYLSHHIYTTRPRNITLEINDYVQLTQDNLGENRFLMIKEIVVQQETNQVLIRGWCFVCNESLQGLLPYSENLEGHEVCLVLQSEDDDSRRAPIQGMETFNISEIVGKIELIITNKDYPMHSSSAGHVCRWVYTRRYATGQARRENECIEESFAVVDETVADSQYLVPAWKMIRRWRGSTSAKMEADEVTAVDLACGAGGASEGLRLAGFKILRGVDLCANACATFRLNHFHAEVIQKDIFHHIQDLEMGRIPTLRPTLAHFSPVCKAATGLNTQVGRRPPNSPQGIRHDQIKQ